MIPRLVLYFSYGLFYWLIKKDIALRKGVSSRAIWIPTLWVGILASRPISSWVGFGGGDDTLEGSPLDRLFFFVLIALALITLSKRRVDWSVIIPTNWPIFLFYGYLLISVLWADSPLVSFKRWFKDLGNIFVLMVILTEVDPQQAFRAVFVRCAYVLIPLSIVFIRYFPSLGRVYNIHSGEIEPVGVTSQKNSLGAMVLVCGLVLIWDWFERSKPSLIPRTRVDRYLPSVLLLIGVYLLHLCDSKTSIACLVLGAAVLAATRLPLLRQRIGAFGRLALAMALIFFIADSIFSVKEGILQFMGRDMTFTGRTDLWHALLSVNTDPILGTGFCSFWSDDHFQSQLPEELTGGRSAHNGYLETYIDGGMVGIFFLVVMLAAVGLKINRQLAASGDYAVVRFSVFIVMLIGNISESHFGRMSPLGFLFLLVAVDPPRAEIRHAAQEEVAGISSMPQDLPGSSAFTLSLR